MTHTEYKPLLELK